jgi:hypothetical protein
VDPALPCILSKASALTRESRGACWRSLLRSPPGGYDHRRSLTLTKQGKHYMRGKHEAHDPPCTIHEGSHRNKTIFVDIRLVDAGGSCGRCGAGGTRESPAIATGATPPAAGACVSLGPPLNRCALGLGY